MGTNQIPSLINIFGTVISLFNILLFLGHSSLMLTEEFFSYWPHFFSHLLIWAATRILHYYSHLPGTFSKIIKSYVRQMCPGIIIITSENQLIIIEIKEEKIDAKLVFIIRIVHFQGLRFA